MFAGTLGGYTRGYILKNISDKPYCASQLTADLKLDYKTIRRHLDILVKNGIISTKEDKFGKIYYISKDMRQNMNEFNQIWEKIQHSL